MKKVLLFITIVLILFSGIALLNKQQGQLTKAEITTKSQNNPFKKDSLHPETIKLAKDPNYQNVITPDELKTKLNNKEDVTVYFYSSTCSYCMQTTPIVSPLAEELGIDLVQFNLLEFENGWKEYKIEGSPTIVQFKAGQEYSRIVGYQEKEVFKEWFLKNSK